MRASICSSIQQQAGGCRVKGEALLQAAAHQGQLCGVLQELGCYHLCWQNLHTSKYAVNPCIVCKTAAKMPASWQASWQPCSSCLHMFGQSAAYGAPISQLDLDLFLRIYVQNVLIMHPGFRYKRVERPPIQDSSRYWGYPLFDI